MHSSGFYKTFSRILFLETVIDNEFSQFPTEMVGRGPNVVITVLDVRILVGTVLLLVLVEFHLINS